MGDPIDRRAALDALEKIDCSDGVGVSALKCDAIDDAVTAIKALPPAQPGWTTDIKDILAYLDDVVHPLVSPEHWNVYSELHDMISGLLKHEERGQDES